MRILVYDSTTSGHNPSWLYSSAQACLDSGNEFVLAAPFGCPNVDAWVNLIDDHDYIKCQVTKKKGRSNFSEAYAIGLEHECDMLFFPYFDHVIQELGRCHEAASGLKGLKIGGIMLRPYSHSTRSIDFLKYLLLKLVRTHSGKLKRRRLRRKLRTAASIPVLKRLTSGEGELKIMSLDCSDAYNSISRSFEFAEVERLTCDPWFSRSQLSREQARLELGLPMDKFIFLHCGKSASEKGLPDALKGWLQLPVELREKSLLLRAGEVPDQKLASELRTYGALRDYYVPQKELDDLYASSDCVLAPYRNHLGSSGVLIHAAAAQRPLVAPDYGVVGKYLTRYDLGFSFEHLNTKSLSNAMSLAINTKYTQSDKARAFVEHNSKERFIAELRSFFFDAVK